MKSGSERIAIVGAGISGLALAHELMARGHAVRLLEVSGRAGGVIQSSFIDGFLVEVGPNSMLIKSRRVEDWIKALGLGDRMVQANQEASKRFIVRNGKPLPVPASPLAALTTPLFSLQAKLGLLGEPWRAASGLEDESVASFVRRRMGPEFLDYAIAPMVSGIFAGDTEQLSMRHAFPKVWNLEASAGSLIRGSLKLKKERKRSGVPRYRSQLISFDRGLQILTDALAAKLSGSLRLNTPLRDIERNGAGRWNICWKGAEGEGAEEFDRVVITIPQYQWAGLPWSEPIRESLETIIPPPHPPVSTLALGFRREQITHPLDGFGMLIPPVEQSDLLGCIFSSSLFPGRAPDGHVALMCFLGGVLNPRMAELEANAAVESASKVLRDLLGVEGEPVMVSHRFWPRAIPQYNLQHGTFLQQLAALESSFPGLNFCGSFRGGPGLNDCIESALDLAARLSA